MDRKEKRHQIDHTIKSLIVPFLREKGFKGSLPHFRRQGPDGINLLTFQHSLNASKFVVEVANCPSDGITTNWGEEIPKNKVTAHDMGQRLRLGSKGENGDYWFDYGKKSLFTDINKKICKEIISLWPNAEAWYEEDLYNQKSIKES